MGDYCKTAISTTFNTGTVMGVCCNIFQPGFPPKHIPSFTWGGSEKESTHFRLPKAIEIIKATMARRNTEMTELDIDLLTELYDSSN